MVAQGRRCARGAERATITSEPVLEVPDADHETMGGEGLTVGRWIRGGEVRMRCDEGGHEGLERDVQDGEERELGMTVERRWLRDPVEVGRDQPLAIAGHAAS